MEDEETIILATKVLHVGVSTSTISIGGHIIEILNCCVERAREFAHEIADV